MQPGRQERQLDENIRLSFGKDHAIGLFMQVQDRRYKMSGKDEQGEGYVLDWDEFGGYSINLIEVDVPLETLVHRDFTLFCEFIISQCDLKAPY